MGLITKTLTIGCACTGLAAASQMPEFAQQYRQRLAGAVQELRVVVEDFDLDAQNSGFTREQALQSLSGSADKFPRERGASMTRSISRFTDLEAQQFSMEQADPVSRPLFMLASPDEALVKGAWEIFEPAVPLNAPGAMWGGFGALLLGLLARLPIGMTRKVSDKFSRRRDKIRVQEAPGILQETMSEEDPDNRAGVVPDVQLASAPMDGSNSLLDQIVLDQGVVGEIDSKGRLITSKRPLNRI